MYYRYYRLIGTIVKVPACIKAVGQNIKNQKIGPYVAKNHISQILAKNWRISKDLKTTVEYWPSSVHVKV